MEKIIILYAKDAGEPRYTDGGLFIPVGEEESMSAEIRDAEAVEKLKRGIFYISESENEGA